MAPELTDSPVDLCLVVPKKTATLEIQLINAGSTKLMLALLDQFIAGLIADARCDCPGIRYAANKIAEQPTPEILGRVQNELHVTERTFQRMFGKKHRYIAESLQKGLSVQFGISTVKQP